MMENVIEIESLRKEYKDFTLKDISFNVPRGYVTGLIGPNGAGKTTIIKLIMGLVRKKSGSIKIFGLDNLEHGVQIKDRIGFVYDIPYFYEDQHLGTLGMSIGRFYSKWDTQYFNSLLERFQLSPKKSFGALSKGMRTKFALAMALSHDADLIIMDEPTTGLDPLFRWELLEMLREIIQSEEKSILFSTHITSDLDRIADHTIFVEGGELHCALWKDETQERWGIVRAREDFITESNKKLFRGWRKRAYGVEALAIDLPKVRQLGLTGLVIEKATLEDILFFLHKGGVHAKAD
jgi:ABC-2 type transport system ATP-binding protein